MPLSQDQAEATMILPEFVWLGEKATVIFVEFVWLQDEKATASIVEVVRLKKTAGRIHHST